MNMKKINKPWGYELIWAENPKYLGKILHIMASKRLSLQYHKVKDETIMVQKGMLRLEIGPSKNDMKVMTLNPGDVQHIPAGHVHRMSGITDVEVLEVSTSESSDVVRLEDDHGRVNQIYPAAIVSSDSH
jgi:mannose-6-phosphate isomerase-like protein (cupin superfamily)